MNELNIEYKLGLKNIKVCRENMIKIGVICECPNEHEIYLFGEEENFDVWLRVLQHEEFHAILHMLGIDGRNHHNIMNNIKELC